MDFRTAMAAARAEAEAKQGKRRKEKSEKKKSRTGKGLGMEPFDPLHHVAKEKADTASMWMMIFTGIGIGLLMRYLVMPSMSHGDSVLWLLPVLTLFLIPPLHRAVMPEKFVEHYTKGTWFRATFLHLFTWLAVTLLLVNPPYGDIGSPEVAKDWVVVIEDEDGNLTFPAEETISRSSKRITQLELYLSDVKSNSTVWLMFAMRDNVDAVGVQVNMTITGPDGQTATLSPSAVGYDALTAEGFNSTWGPRLVQEIRVMDHGVAVELDGLSVGFWEIRLTLSEEGVPWKNVSEEYAWTLRVLE